jgi:hypothetical protein
MARNIIQNGPDVFLPPGDPSLECPYITREKLLRCVVGITYRCYRWWLSGFSHWVEQPSKKARDLVQGIQGSGVPGIMNIQLMLHCAQDKCKCISCHQTRMEIEFNMVNDGDDGAYISD